MHTLPGFVALALLLAAFAGCLGGDPEEGSTSFYVKDAPTDEFAEIHVVFQKIEVHAAGDANANDTDDASGWTTVYANQSGTDLDLLAASDPDQAYFLGEANLSAGRYTQIRIHTTAAYGVDADGNRTDFTLSNGVLKVVRSFAVNATMETRIVIDFDLDRAIHQQGPQGWRMTPVIGKTTVEEVEDDDSGADVDQEGDLSAV